MGKITEFEIRLVFRNFGSPDLVISNEKLVESREEFFQSWRKFVRIETPESEVLGEKHKLNHFLEEMLILVIFNNFDN